MISYQAHRFTDVESTIQKTVRELQRLRDAAKTHKDLMAMECELDLASRIQQAMVPQISWPAAGVSGLELCAEMVTARMVGGDFYDLFQIDPARIGFLIGDVAGKGVLAGLFMTATRALMRATAGQYALPGECLSRVNQLLCREDDITLLALRYLGPSSSYLPSLDLLAKSSPIQPAALA